VPDDATGSDIQILRQAKRDVVEAQKNVDETILNSPFDGSIVEINGHDGELFSAGQPFIVMADFSTLEVQTTDMSEVDAGRVHVGDTAKVSFDALPASDVTGKVTQIALKNSSGSGVYYTVIIALDKIPEDLRWGMSAFVVVNVK
jgi:multidrug resistance efflux pump